MARGRRDRRGSRIRRDSVLIHAGHDHVIRYVRSWEPMTFGSHGPDGAERVAWCAALVLGLVALRVAFLVFSKSPGAPVHPVIFTSCEAMVDEWHRQRDL